MWISRNREFCHLFCTAEFVIVLVIFFTIFVINSFLCLDTLLMSPNIQRAALYSNLRYGWIYFNLIKEILCFFKFYLPREPTFLPVTFFSRPLSLLMGGGDFSFFTLIIDYINTFYLNFCLPFFLLLLLLTLHSAQILGIF